MGKTQIHHKCMAAFRVTTRTIKVSIGNRNTVGFLDDGFF